MDIIINNKPQNKDYIINPLTVAELWDRGILAYLPKHFNLLQKKLEKLQNYKSKLNHIFFLTGKFYFPNVYENLEGKNGKFYGKELSFLPTNKEENEIYNSFVQEQLLALNDNQFVFYDYDMFHSELEEYIKVDPKQTKDVIISEIKRIERLFPYNEQYERITVFHFGDNTRHRINVSTDSRVTELFHFFRLNRTIDFSREYIHPFHHIEILVAQEALKYYKHLKELDAAEAQVKPLKYSKTISQVGGNLNNPHKIFNDLDDLFESKSIACKYYQILIDAKLIDSNLKFYGKPKAALCVWYNTLKIGIGNRPAVIKYDKKKADDVLANLIMKKFQMESFSKRNFDAKSLKGKASDFEPEFIDQALDIYSSSKNTHK